MYVVLGVRRCGLVEMGEGSTRVCIVVKSFDVEVLSSEANVVCSSKTLRVPPPPGPRSRGDSEHIGSATRQSAPKLPF